MDAENQLVEQLTDVGIRVLEPPNSTSELVGLLDEVRAVLSKVGQKPSEAVKEALLPSMKGLTSDALFRNSDPDIKITLAACLNEIMRISAPVAPYGSGTMKDIFELIVSSFDSLSTLHGRCYSKAVVILENVAKLRSCVMMLDLDCDSLITKMFELFLKNTSSDHPRSVLLAMETIMSVLIKESDDISQELLELLLASIKKENKDISPASWKMGAKVIEQCSEKLKPYIMKTMVSTGSSLEDYAPALAEVCKEEHDIVKNLTEDSSKDVVNSKPFDDESPPLEFVQGLKAIDRSNKKVVSETDNKTKGDLRIKSETNTSKRAKKPNPDNPNEGNKKAMTDDKDTPSGDRTKKKGRQLNNDASRLSGNKENPAGASRKDRSQMKDVSKSKSQRKGVSIDDDDDDADNVYDDDNDEDDDNDDGSIETPYGRKSYKEDLIGVRIKVWWPLDRRFYEGLISSYDAPGRKHKVNYDDGDKESLNLQEEKWELIGDELAADIDLKFDEKKTQPNSNGPQRGISTEGEEGTSQTLNSKKETPDSGPNPEDGTHQVSKTMGKSKRPGVSADTKRPRLML